MKKTIKIALSLSAVISIFISSLSAAAIYWVGENNDSIPIATTARQGTAVVKNDGAGGKKLTDAYNRITGENLTKPTPSSSGEHISENYMGTPASSCYSYTIETDFILFDDKTTLGQIFNLYDDLPGVSPRTSNWYDLYRISADGITVTNRFSDTDKTVFDGVGVGQWHSFAATFTWELIDAGKNHYALTGMKFWLDGNGPVVKTLSKTTYGVYRFAFGAFSETADYGIDNLRHCVDKEYKEPETLPEITSKIYTITEDTIQISDAVFCNKFMRAITAAEGCEIVLFTDNTFTSAVTGGKVAFGNIAAVRSDSRVRYYEITRLASYTLVDTNDEAVIMKSGAEASREYSLSADCSIKWSNHSENTSIRFNDLLTDGKSYNAVEFSIYSVNATGETFAFIIDCKPQVEGKLSYFKADITVNWTGWKKFRLITGATLSCVRNARLSELVDCRFTLEGWNMQPVDGTELYIDSITLNEYDPSLIDSYYSADEVEKADNLLRTVYCTYAGSAAVLEKGGVTTIDSGNYNAVPYIAADGSYMLPKEFLNNILNLNIECEAYINSERLSEYGYHTIISKNILVISESLSEAQAVAQSAAALDITEFYIQYCYDMYSEEDFAAFREKMRTSLIGAETDDRENTYAKKYKNAVDSAATACLENMDISSGGAPWGEIGSSSALAGAFKNIYTLSRAYAMPEGGYYGNEELYEHIIYALDYITDNYYTGDDNSLYTNDWYTAKILCAGNFINTLLLMDEHIPDDKMGAYLKKLSFYNNINSVLADSVINTASNLSNMVYSVMAAAAIKEDAEELLACRDILMKEYENDKSGEGFYTDGSYIMHGSHAYNNGYGIVEFTSMQEFDSWFRDSAFCGNEFKKCFWRETLIKAYLDQCYEGEFIGIFNSRMIGNGSNPTWYMYPFLHAYNLSEDSDKAMWAGIVKGFLHRNKSANYLNYITAYPYSCFIALREIAADDSIAPMSAREINRAYNSSAKITHMREDFGFGISMFSPDIADYECINGENTEGWYHNWGRTALYNSDHFQYDKSYWKYINPLRIPGTTVDTRPMEKITIDRGNESFNERSFVGGVTLKGKYGTAAMDYRGIHLDENLKNDSTLNVQKAWFMFDEEIVALGSGINSNDGYDVITVAENRMLHGEEELAVNGQTFSCGETETEISNVDTVWLENTGGYYFPNTESVTACKTAGEKRFFEMYINHGENPRDETYSYVILPGMTVQQTAQYSSEPAVEILSNTKDIQAVRHKKLGITGIVFRKAGTMCNITVSQPCLVMAENTQSGITVSVTEPTGDVDEIMLRIAGSFGSVEANGEIFSSVINSSGAEITVRSSEGINSEQFALLAPGKSCGFTYEIYKDEGYAAITGINTSVLNTEELLHTIDIPAEIAGYPVKEISDFAFAGESADGVNYEGFAFNGKKPIYHVNIPDTVKKIGTGAFYGCCNLQELSMPDSVTAIGGYLFKQCVNLKKVRLSAGLTDIPQLTFYDCFSLSEIYLPRQIVTAESNAFNTSDSDREICCTMYSSEDRKWVFENRNSKIDYEKAYIKDNKNGTVSAVVFAENAVVIKAEYESTGGLGSVLTVDVKTSAEDWYKETEIPVSENCCVMIFDLLQSIRPIKGKYSK